jgi:hypothetical protein
MSSNDERERQSDRFRQAIERKNQEAQERAEASRAEAEEGSLLASDRPQDEFDVRAKSSGHGKKTADKWNQ